MFNVPANENRGEFSHIMFKIQPDSYVVSGGAVIQNPGGADDYVDVSEVRVAVQGKEYIFPARDAADQLNQNDVAPAALGAGESYKAIFYVNSSGVQVLKGSKGTPGTAPTQPSDTVLLATVTVDYDASGSSVIETADIVDEREFYQLTYGSNTVTKTLEMVSEGMANVQTPYLSNSLSPYQSRVIEGKSTIEGTADVELSSENGTRLIATAFNGITTTNPTGTVYNHVMKPGTDRFLRSFYSEFARDKGNMAFAYPQTVLAGMSVDTSGEIVKTQFKLVAHRENTVADAVLDGSGDYTGTVYTRGDLDLSVATDATITMTTDTTGALDGTAKVTFAIGDASASSAVAVNVNTWIDVVDASGNDTGIQVLFDKNDPLTSNDVWTFSTLRTGSTPTVSSVNPFADHQASLSIGGTEYCYEDFKLDIDFGILKRACKGTKYSGGFISSKWVITGSISRPLDIDGQKFIRDWKSTREKSLSLALTGATISGNYSHSITFDLAKVVFTGDTPVVGGGGSIPHTLNFQAYYTDSTDPELKITTVCTISDLLA